MKEIKLTKGKVALVDDQDFERVNEHKWSARHSKGGWYAVSAFKIKGVWKNIDMHVFIVNPQSGYEVDHKDGNGLNNQRQTNLRVATHKQNRSNSKLSSSNTSGFKGVSRDKRRNKWMAYICPNGKFIQLGRFDNILDAARAYDQGAVKHFGEFARTNASLGLL